jgi:hypothetical protein
VSTTRFPLVDVVFFFRLVCTSWSLSACGGMISLSLSLSLSRRGLLCVLYDANDGGSHGRGPQISHRPVRDYSVVSRESPTLAWSSSSSYYLFYKTSIHSLPGPLGAVGRVGKKGMGPRGQGTRDDGTIRITSTMEIGFVGWARGNTTQDLEGWAPRAARNARVV